MAKMRKLILFFPIVIFFHTVHAQEIEWQNTIGGAGFEWFESAIRTSDGGYLLGGTSNSNISGDKTENSFQGSYDYWIVKTDSLGNIIWQNTIGGFNGDWLPSLIQTTDGGFLLGGYSYSDISGDKTENSQGQEDFWIVKTDSIGNILWQNTIGGSNWDRLNDVQQTPDGGFLLGGYSNSDISGDKTENSKGTTDFWIVKTNSAGNIQWQKTIGGNFGEQITTVILSSDGGYLFCGYSNSNISGDKTENSQGSNDFWIVKTDSAGVILWQNTIGGNNNDEIYSAVQTSDNGYLLGGRSASDISGDKTENSNGGLDYWIVKVDSLGNVLWQKTFGGSGDDHLVSLVQTYDAGFVLGGTSHSDISGNKTESLSGIANCWVIKTDSLGKIEWQNNIGGNKNDGVNNLIFSSDGGIFLGGESNSNISGDKTENSLGYQDFWILSLRTDYNLIHGNGFADLNSNFIKDGSEQGIPHRQIFEINSGRFSFLQQNGDYSIMVMDTGIFQVVPNYLNYFAPSPSSHNITFNSINLIDSLNDFAFQPNGVLNDLCITITPTTPFRSGFNAGYQINYSNVGTSVINNTVVVFYPDSNLSNISFSTTPVFISPDSVVWNIGTLAPFQSGNIVVVVNVNLGVPIGTSINSGAKIEPVAGDANPTCNINYREVVTTGSYDPNDILVNRSSLFTSEFPNPPYLDYIIRFQNTGNDTAFNVNILNPIDTMMLDLSTFVFVAASHSLETQFIYYQKNLEFKFENILLPDSGINEQMSHGFVRYRIKPKSSLTVVDTIRNFAAIYFDFNDPVITNTAVTDIITPTLTPEYFENNVSVYPNPFDEELSVWLKGSENQKISIELSNVYGQTIKILYSESIGSGSRIYKFDTGELAQGVYILTVIGNKSIAQKIIKLQ